MGKSLNQILTDAADGGRIGVTLVTNQDDGGGTDVWPIVGYAYGYLIYSPPGWLASGYPFPGRLANAPHEPLTFYFSDRRTNGVRQPFRADQTDHLGLSLSISLSLPHTASFTFIDWGGGVFNFSLEERENLLIGTGPSLGISDNAVYVLSFVGPLPPPEP